MIHEKKSVAQVSIQKNFGQQVSFPGWKRMTKNEHARIKAISATRTLLGNSTKMIQHDNAR
jgi:hypothetical protein